MGTVLARSELERLQRAACIIPGYRLDANILKFIFQIFNVELYRISRRYFNYNWLNFEQNLMDGEPNEKAAFLD